ncbi:HAD-IIIA family hydrolase [Gammaproteobacteria bacterium]|nr:HAD-IIIA family hydrolase [Gammaproteobacteria bacterium]
MKEIHEKAKKIKLIIFDVDGVLTAGILNYNFEGIITKNFHVHDGQGIKLLKQSGVEVGIITSCESNIINKRMQDLNINYVYQGQFKKTPAYEDLKLKLKLQDHEIAYMGDDIPDLPILKKVGLSITVANAPELIKNNVNMITLKKGGKGAVREVCDLIMQAQNTYDSIIESYF